MFFPAGPLVWIAYAVLSIALHAAFVFLMRAPTRTGRQVMDEIEGFGAQDLLKTGMCFAEDLQTLGRADGCVHGGRVRNERKPLNFRERNVAPQHKILWAHKDF